MKAIKTMFIGAGIGFAAAMALVVLGLGCDLLNCACQIITCNCTESPSMMGMAMKSFGPTATFCTICGAVIGLIYGLCKLKEEADAIQTRRRMEESERARQQRKKWAGEMKQKVQQVEKICKNNTDSWTFPLEHTTYKADAMMDRIACELTNASELQGKVNSMAADIKEEGV